MRLPSLKCQAAISENTASLCGMERSWPQSAPTLQPDIDCPTTGACAMLLKPIEIGKKLPVHSVLGGLGEGGHCCGDPLI